MPRINVKLDDVESGFETYPEGSYLVELQETSKIAKSKSGFPKVIWISKILEGEFEGKLLSWDTSLQDQALWNLKGMLEQIDGVEWDEDGFELDDCTYQKLIVDVIVEEWEGTPRNYVRGYHKV